MKNKGYQLVAVVCCSLMFLAAVPGQVRAEEYRYLTVDTETSSTVSARIDAPNVTIYEEPSYLSKPVNKAAQGKTYSVLDVADDGWARISTEPGQGYIKVARNATLVEKTSRNVDTSAKARKDLVNYALQFVGNRYIYGGSDPNRGADCSGFTSYVLQHAAGVSLPHSSGGQSSYGKKVSLDGLRPGDLLFYGGSGYIDHVALYIGNSKVVHASSARTGIKVSPYDYRTPVKMVNVLGD